MAAVGQFITADTWVSAFTLAGLLSGSPVEIENIGREELRYIVNIASPTLSDKVNAKILSVKEKVILPFGLSYIWLIGDFDGTRINIAKHITENNIFQNYQEANTKTGNAFKFSTRKTGITSGATAALVNNLYFGVTTGAFPLTIKARYLSALGTSEVVYSAYEDSVFTGGSTITPLNQGRLATRLPLFSVVQDPVITSLGVQYLPDFSLLSSGNTISRLGTDSIGDETNLKPNTKHIFRANNIGTGTADVLFLQILCYEGPLDYPI